MSEHQFGRPSRRSVLSAAALGAVGSVAGLGSSSALAHEPLDGHNEIAGVPIYYNGTTRSTQYFNPTFYTRLESWWNNHYFPNTPGHWSTPARIHHLGVHVDKGGMHQYGRAIDLTAIKMTDKKASPFEFHAANFNESQFKNWGTPSVWYKRYWGAVASLSHHFSYVLTYLYNDAHDDHVHADNQASVGGNASFNSGSRAQVVVVQGSLRRVWNKSISEDGVWGSQTSGLVNQVLSSIGRPSGLGSSGNWAAYCTATCKQGTLA